MGVVPGGRSQRETLHRILTDCHFTFFDSEEKTYQMLISTLQKILTIGDSYSKLELLLEYPLGFVTLKPIAEAYCAARVKANFKAIHTYKHLVQYKTILTVICSRTLPAVFVCRSSSSSTFNFRTTHLRTNLVSFSSPNKNAKMALRLWEVSSCPNLPSRFLKSCQKQRF